jgi:hypothetical protein
VFTTTPLPPYLWNHGHWRRPNAGVLRFAQDDNLFDDSRFAQDDNLFDDSRFAQDDNLFDDSRFAQDDNLY